MSSERSGTACIDRCVMLCFGASFIVSLKMATTLRCHRGLILNWFKARGTMLLVAVDDMNTRLKLVTRTSYGFRTYGVAEIALFHNLGDLPLQKLPADSTEEAKIRDHCGLLFAHQNVTAQSSQRVLLQHRRPVPQESSSCLQRNGEFSLIATEQSQDESSIQ